MAIAIISANSGPSRDTAATTQRVDTIRLFGSKQLVRQGRNWSLVSSAEQPQQLTEREAMFVNAALNAARGQQ